MQQHNIFHGLLSIEGEGRVTETSWRRLSCRKKVQLPRESILILPFDSICCHFEAGIIRTQKKLVSKFGLLAKLLLQPRFRVLMWSHHSCRSWQWISPNLLPGRPCKVLSWVWSVELAMTSWVLSPRVGAGAENACPNYCHFQEIFHFFPHWQQVHSFTAFMTVSPE